MASPQQQPQPPVIQQQPAQQLSKSTPILNVVPATSTVNEELEKQMEEIRERLLSAESQLMEERNARNALIQKVGADARFALD